MQIGEALYSYLSSYAGLTALVGNRIYPLILPQGVTLPAVTYTQISGPRVHCMGSDPGLTHPRFQVSVWAESYSDMATVAAQVRAALQDYSGTMGGDDGVVVQRIFLEDETDRNFEPNTKTFRRDLDFIIWHEE